MSRSAEATRAHLRAVLEAKKKKTEEAPVVSSGSPANFKSEQVATKGYLVRRKILANLAINYVKKTLSFGASNAPSGITVLPKAHSIMERHLPMGQQYASLAHKKLAITQCIEALKKSQEPLTLSPAERGQLNAAIAIYLMHFLFGHELIKTVEDFKDLKKHATIVRLFQTGNCGSQVFLALEYLLENHLEESCIFPIKVFQAAKVGAHLRPKGIDPEDGHQSLLLGRLSAEDKPFGEDISDNPDALVCDPWQGKAFLFSQWHTEAPKGLQGKGFDFDNSETMFHINTPDEARKQLALVSEQVVVEGVSSLEVQQWVKAFVGIFAPESTVAPAILPLHQLRAEQALSLRQTSVENKEASPVSALTQNP